MDYNRDVEGEPRYSYEERELESKQLPPRPRRMDTFRAAFRPPREPSPEFAPPNPGPRGFQEEAQAVDDFNVAGAEEMQYVTSPALASTGQGWVGGFRALAQKVPPVNLKVPAAFQRRGTHDVPYEPSEDAGPTRPSALNRTISDPRRMRAPGTRSRRQEQQRTQERPSEYDTPEPLYMAPSTQDHTLVDHTAPAPAQVHVPPGFLHDRETTIGHNYMPALATLSSPILASPKPASDYAKMPPPAHDQTLGEYFAQLWHDIVAFFRAVIALPWIAELVTADYYPAENPRSKLRTHRERPITEELDAFYSPRLRTSQYNTGLDPGGGSFLRRPKKTPDELSNRSSWYLHRDSPRPQSAHLLASPVGSQRGNSAFMWGGMAGVGSQPGTGMGINGPRRSWYSPSPFPEAAIQLPNSPMSAAPSQMPMSTRTTRMPVQPTPMPDVTLPLPPHLAPSNQASSPRNRETSPTPAGYAPDASVYASPPRDRQRGESDQLVSPNRDPQDLDVSPGTTKRRGHKYTSSEDRVAPGSSEDDGYASPPVRRRSRDPAVKVTQTPTRRVRRPRQPDNNLGAVDHPASSVLPVDLPSRRRQSSSTRTPRAPSSRRRERSASRDPSPTQHKTRRDPTPDRGYESSRAEKVYTSPHRTRESSREPKHASQARR